MYAFTDDSIAIIPIIAVMYSDSLEINPDAVARVLPKKKDTTLYMQASSITAEGLVDILMSSGLKSSVVPVVYTKMIVVMKAKLL